VNELKQEYSNSDIGLQRLRKGNKKGKTDCNEDVSNDDLLFPSAEENPNKKFSDIAPCNEVNDVGT